MFLGNIGNKTNTINNYIPDFKTKKILEEVFYKFSPEGKLMIGFEGMKKWCEDRNMNLEEKINNFLKIKEHIEELQNYCGLISAKNSFGKHFENIYLDEIYYADQYNWMEFGRGKLAEMTFYAKQSQNKNLIEQANNEIFLKLECIILNGNFDAIAITPWSIDRKNQLLGLLKEKLKQLNLPFINIIKYYENNIPIPQKSLKTREQRMQNAKNTIYVEDKNIAKYKKVFLIDDFVGSGSTLNETAKKLKEKSVEEVIGFSYVGNLNLSYEIINEV
ncbi:MAG: phosphoribosyltransferase family protein [Candidatus Gracilibacteria bacterium]|nr:phosphoribosyltransferase family protein [Candidatus Gracilibacteria bacterium]